MATSTTKAALARAYSRGTEPVFVSTAPNGRDEMWAIDEFAFVVPVIPSDAPPELEFALRVRRNALLTGSCDECGALVGSDIETAVGSTNITATFIPHRRNCVAADSIVGPKIDEHHRRKASESLEDAVEEASRRTREELARQIPDAIYMPTDQYESWAQELVDARLDSGVSSMCDHLASDPAQTWTMLIGLNKWHCDECWSYLQYDMSRNGPVLSPIDDFTCDYCSRYVNNLYPLVVRVGTFVLRGGLCRRCSREAGLDLAQSRERGYSV